MITGNLAKCLGFFDSSDMQVIFKVVTTILYLDSIKCIKLKEFELISPNSSKTM